VFISRKENFYLGYIYSQHMISAYKPSLGLDI